MPLRRLAIALAAAFPLASPGADIVLAPPAGGGVAITNSAGATTRLRVADDGLVTLPGLTALPVAGMGLCIDAATGRIGTCTLAGGNGTVTRITAGAGLTGGVITTAGTIGLDVTQLLPTSACSAGEVPKWSGFEWACGSDATGSGTVAGLTALPPLAATGGATPQVSLTGGTTGQVLAWTAGGPDWTGSLAIPGTLTLPAASTASAGTVFKGANRFLSTPGNNSVFLGVNSGSFSASGFGNVAVGEEALSSLTTGFTNTAVGSYALMAAQEGFNNTAVGHMALNANEGLSNTAVGGSSMSSSTTGEQNTIVGASTAFSLTTGSFNTVLGTGAMGSNVSGGHNIVIGAFAGNTITLGNNIVIGNAGQAEDAGRIRIGSPFTHLATHIAGIRGVTTDLADAIPVVISSTGQLGTASSSRRVKQDIEDMGEASRVLMALRPVTFRYRSQAAAGQGALQYGLVAEEVADVAPGLAVRSAEGSIETVNYPALVPMLLNELQKQQRVIDAQAARLERLEAALGIR